ncbi:hypothetical protein C7T36_18405 [Rhodococcus sp. AD45-ID]|uniref:hypothetical protein n=1 Tax=unclassified Rhodococcus (in: high G+C Gram-positive bacteria) TaxID=192944 RepID=UPI0005D44962|nr:MULTISPECIES: hypothetical protein [unclassified Rhodococcus (in: high G+C Gram-positive bacteria)]KJF21954.1 hypothetical protein SZ00_02598 [Rhodococcus sp. AD45]PSR39650.1 hypothetical protein C7T36_18405 [Rhodococcus sp. AD45-ID]
MSDDNKPYRSGPPIETGDRIAVEIGDQRFEGAAQVESGRFGRQKITIIPDGEPMLYGRDYAFSPSPPDEIRAEAGLQITTHRWLPREPIPYDEMRRLCGLPDVSAYIAQRELARMGKELREGFRRFEEAWTEAAEQALPGLRAISEAAKPRQTPPMWADIPGRNHRPAKTRNHRRVK